jgi:nucleotide-binding universal stress UspA family protein
MKTLLVPVDFSESAYNALRYAYRLALENHSNIVMLNCYQIPSGQANVMIDFKDILERDSLNGLQDFQERITLEFGIAPVELKTESYYGFLYEGVQVMLNRYHIDLVVMGTTGASNFVKKFFGSNTSHLLRKIKAPILIVPELAQWNGWEHTVFASDFLSENTAPVFNNFKGLINGMNINIDVLHIIDKAGVSKPFEKMESKIIADSQKKSLDFHYEPADNIVDGILNYTKVNPCDLIILVRKKHGLVEQLFAESVTRKMALHSKNPVLLLQE